jgi:hypothetical protein
MTKLLLLNFQLLCEAVWIIETLPECVSKGAEIIDLVEGGWTEREGLYIRVGFDTTGKVKSLVSMSGLSLLELLWLQGCFSIFNSQLWFDSHVTILFFNLLIWLEQEWILEPSAVWRSTLLWLCVFVKHKELLIRDGWWKEQSEALMNAEPEPLD